MDKFSNLRFPLTPMVGIKLSTTSFPHDKNWIMLQGKIVFRFSHDLDLP